MKKTIKKINIFILNLFIIIIFFKFVISCTNSEKLNNIIKKNIDFQKPPENSNWELINTEKFTSGDEKNYFIIWNNYKEKKWIITHFKNNFKKEERKILENKKNIELITTLNIFFLQIYNSETNNYLTNIYLNENSDPNIFYGLYRYNNKNINEINLPKINEENGLILNWN